MVRNLIQMHICSLITNLVFEGSLSLSLAVPFALELPKNFFPMLSLFVQCTFLTKLISATTTTSIGETRQLYQLATTSTLTFD